jgi:drug/metabolite transporter (DMT)-like permease
VLVAGMAIAAVGTALLTGARGLALGPGEAITIAGAALFALQVVALAWFAPGADPLALAAVQAGAMAAALAPFAIARTDPALFGADLLPRLAYLVIAGSALAPLLQVIAQRTLSAGRTGLLLGLEPVFAAGFAMTLGGEHPRVEWWVGAALIVIAIGLVEWGASRAPRDTSRPASG